MVAIGKRVMLGLLSAGMLCVGLITLFLLAQSTTRSAGADGGVATGVIRNFTLYVRDNYIQVPNGDPIYVIGFTDDPNGKAQVPGPTLDINQGDTVNLTLMNDKDPTQTPLNPSGDGHTIHLHGLDLDSMNDGDPMTAPQGANPVMPGHSYTYHFVATKPGTYFYHCHQEAVEHQQMGMYGAVIIHPRIAGKVVLNKAYPATPSYDKEYTFVLSEMDSRGHAAVYGAMHNGTEEYNWIDYRPNYFLMNGKALPDTLNDPRSAITGRVGQTVLLRLIDTGDTVHAMHTHGFHMMVIAKDGRPLPAPEMMDTVSLSPGEKYDVLVTFNQAGTYMFHDHIGNHATNNGAYPGGMATMITVADASGHVPGQSMLMPSGK